MYWHPCDMYSFVQLMHVSDCLPNTSELKTP